MKDKIKIGITGASGLIGSHLAKLLLDTGEYDVKGLHVSSFIPQMLENYDMEWVQGDIRSFEIIPDFVEDLDIVIHAAAVVSFKKSDNDRMFQINIEGTKNLVNHLLDTNKKLIHISSIATLGRKNGKPMVDEKDFWNDSLHFTSYAHSKFLAEMEVERGISEGLEAMIVLPSIVLGNSERNTSSSNIWSQIQKFPSFSPRGANGFVDVHDVASYIHQCILDWKQGERMILSGHNLKYSYLYDFVNRFQNRDVKVRAMSPRALLILLPFVLLFFKLFKIRSEISRSAIITTSKSYDFDNSHSIELYGDLYTNIDITLERILKLL